MFSISFCLSNYPFNCLLLILIDLPILLLTRLFILFKSLLLTAPNTVYTFSQPPQLSCCFFCLISESTRGNFLSDLCSSL